MEYRANDEREINLLEIMWEFFIQWKPAVIFSIIISIVTTSAMYVKDMHTYNKALAAYRKSMTSAGEDIESAIGEAGKALTDVESYTVENAVYNMQMVREYEQKISGINELNMQGDTMDYLVLRYAVSTDEVPVTGVMAAYGDKVRDMELRDEIEKEIPAYGELRKIMDVVTYSYADVSNAEENTYSTFAVSALLTEGADAEEINRIIADYVNDAMKEINSSIPHELQYISHTETSVLNTTINDRIQGFRDKIATLKGTVAKDASSFTEGQKELYKYMLIKEGLADEGDNIISFSDEEEQADVSTAGDVAAAESILTEPVMPKGPSVKYILIGFIAGLFIYALIILCVYIFKGRVRSLEEVTDCYRIRGIDEVHDRRFDTTLRKFMYSKALYDIHFNKEGKSLDSHISDAKRYVAESAAHNELKHVTLIPAYADISEDGLCRKYTEGFKKSWDAAIPMEVSGNWTTEYTAEAPGEKEGIVILMRAGDTAFKTLEHIGAYCKDYGATVLGTVLLEG